MALFPHLLLPILWERPGNIPPLVRLLQAYVEKGGKQIDPGHIVSLLIV
jgi:exportin-2 (importin alpha re-exporter)